MSARRTDIMGRIKAGAEIRDAGHDTPCWLWTGATSGNGRGGGYPRMKLNDHTCAVHKVSFVNVHGYVPGNKQIDHKCRNRLCVNPDHLEMVSHIENQKRRDAANGVERKKRKRAKTVAKQSPADARSHGSGCHDLEVAR